jgi:hypothetical protein
MTTSPRTVQEVAQKLFEAIKAQQIQVQSSSGGIVIDGVTIARQQNSTTTTRQAYL